MTPALALLGLALLDALNPFSIAAMAVLLATDRPVARGLAFACGTFAVYLAFGVALVAGWTALLAGLLPLLPPWAPGAAAVAAGLATAGAGVWTWRTGAAGAMPRVTALSVGATLAFAVASTLADLPTAVPLFAAATQVTALAGAWAGRLAWLAAYCLLYVAPLLLLLAGRLLLGDRAAPLTAAVTRGVDWAFARLLPPALVLGGAALAAWGAWLL